jgi:hypothetical protein
VVSVYPAEQRRLEDLARPQKPRIRVRRRGSSAPSTSSRSVQEPFGDADPAITCREVDHVAP